MKNPVTTVFALAAFLLAGAFVQAQPEIKLVTVSVGRAYDSYWKTKENQQKLADAQSKAQEQVNQLQKELEGLVAELKKKEEESKNTALSESARKRAEEEAREMFQNIRAKEQEAQQFVQNTQRSLQMRQQNHRDLMLEEINNVILDIAKEKGATLVLDTSGPTAIGISAILYADEAYDITDEVIAELNKDAPEPEAASE
ncbi:MAG: OmpH family outer membrane protein [Verrucomicrobia bacterium]|nr:MAG: OmpH family outer membrane protein [Verrucomicrobiota bacterium]